MYDASGAMSLRQASQYRTHAYMPPQGGTRKGTSNINMTCTWLHIEDLGAQVCIQIAAMQCSYCDTRNDNAPWMTVCGRRSAPSAQNRAGYHGSEWHGGNEGLL